MTARRRKTPAPKKYRVVFMPVHGHGGLMESIDVPGVFKTRAAGLKALRSAKNPETIKAYRYRVSMRRERAL